MHRVFSLILPTASLTRVRNRITAVIGAKKVDVIGSSS
jgi:hypothetical protein